MSHLASFNLPGAVDINVVPFRPTFLTTPLETPPMFVRSVKACLASVIIICTLASQADACHRRSRCCVPLCYPSDCSPCCVYRLSEPIEQLGGPYHPIVRAAKMGHGVIVQVDAHQGTQYHPVSVNVTQSGPGHLHYSGYNVCVIQPVGPGTPIRWSIFLCPTKVGPSTVTLNFTMSGGPNIKVPFSFDVVP